MRKLYVIGMGAGDPEYMTAQAIRALNEIDVLFVLQKEEEQQDLVELRRVICERFIDDPESYRVVEAPDPPRERGTASYRDAVADWRRRRADLCVRLIRDEVGDGERGAFLAWGDPALYDSTLGVIQDILARGDVAFEYEVVPGISSVQALAAGHRIALNRVGGAVQVTTGRRLADSGMPAGVDDVVVMLDAQQTFAELGDEDLDIYWGAYLGTPDEILVSGHLSDVAEKIVRVRAEARTRKGWMFDTYLLRRVRR
jgi:precorrin-6A synthase